MIRGQEARANLRAIKTLVDATVYKVAQASDWLDPQKHPNECLQVEVEIYALSELFNMASALLNNGTTDSSTSNVGVLAIRAYMATSPVEKQLLQLRLGKALQHAAKRVRKLDNIREQERALDIFGGAF